MCGANGAARYDALSVIGVFMPISVLLWFILSACVLTPHPPRKKLSPLSQHLWYGLNVCGWGWESCQCSSPVRLSVCTVQGLWIICTKARPSGNINNSRSICLPWWVSVSPISGSWEIGGEKGRRTKKSKVMEPGQDERVRKTDVRKINTREVEVHEMLQSSSHVTLNTGFTLFSYTHTHKLLHRQLQCWVAMVTASC